jgi:hypothetical protein
MQIRPKESTLLESGFLRENLREVMVAKALSGGRRTRLRAMNVCLKARDSQANR